MAWKSNLERPLVFKLEETKYFEWQSWSLLFVLDFVLFSIKQKQAFVRKLNPVTHKENCLSASLDSIGEDNPARETPQPHVRQEMDIISLHQSLSSVELLCGLKKIEHLQGALRNVAVLLPVI